MPILEEEGRLTKEDLDQLRRKNKCAVCGERLDTFLDRDSGRVFLACHNWPTNPPDSHHEGIERVYEPSAFETDKPDYQQTLKRGVAMEKEIGLEKTRALSKYIGTGIITRAIATEIVESLWGAAPPVEKTKAILLCHTYQLNPLMKHIYLVGYRRKDRDGKFIMKDGKPVLDWSIQIGIGATRLLAQRRHNYSYLDLTPRKATKEEIEKILGDEADSNTLYAFTHIKDIDTKAEAFGLRGIGKSEKVKGEEKGNTPLNMACIRSERLALDRQYPGEMPQGVEVIDERFEEATDAEYEVVEDEAQAAAARKVLEDGGELKDGTYLGKIDGKPVYYGYDAAGNKIEGGREAAKSPADKRAEAEPEPIPKPIEEALLQGPTLDELKKIRDKVDEAIKRRESPNQEPESEPGPELEPAPETTKLGFDPVELMDNLKTVHWSDTTVKSYLKNSYQVDTQGTVIEVVARLTREQKEKFFKAIQDRLDKLTLL